MRRLLAVLASLLLVGLTPQVAVGQGVPVTENAAPEVQLAFIDSNQNPVPNRLVAQYASLLNTLERRCEQDRRMVSDMTVQATQSLEEDYGKDFSNLSFLRQLRDATEGVGVQDCAEIGATLIVMIGEGG